VRRGGREEAVPDLRRVYCDATAGFGRVRQAEGVGVADWRSELRALAAVGETDLLPLLIFNANPPSPTPWPAELAEPSAVVREFFSICDGAYLDGHRFFSLAELLPENRYWWKLLEEYPRPGGGPIDRAHHVILAFDASGFPLVWDRRTDQVVTFFYKDRDDLDPSGPTLDEFLTEIFSPDSDNDTWAEALQQLRELGRSPPPGPHPHEPA
jgi:hypothetical protein